jgi:hypothetical protein
MDFTPYMLIKTILTLAEKNSKIYIDENLKKSCEPHLSQKLTAKQYEFISRKSLNAKLSNKEISETDCIFEIYDTYVYSGFADSYLFRKRFPSLPENIFVNYNLALSRATQDKFYYSHFSDPKNLKFDLLCLDQISQEKLDSWNNHQYIVIKPLRASRGRGIIIAPVARLNDYLAFIRDTQKFKKDDHLRLLNPSKLTELFKAIKAKYKIPDSLDWTMNYWTEDADNFNGESFVLLQEFKQGKLIDGFDPTGRIVFIYRENGEMEIVDGYWKFPEKKLAQEQTEDLQTQHISNVSLSDIQPNSKLMTTEEKEQITKILFPQLQQVFTKALSATVAEHKSGFCHSTDAAVKAYGEAMRLRTEEEPEIVTNSKSEITGIGLFATKKNPNPSNPPTPTPNNNDGPKCVIS